MLGIPMNEKQATRKLNDLKVDQIDSGTFNGQKFFNIAGVGFDAHVSACFATSYRRGLMGYVQVALTEIISYQSQRYVFEIDGKSFEREAFLVSVANSAQYGNSMYIAPLASVKDGLLDVCIIKRLPLYYFPLIGFHLFNKTLHKSKYVEIIQGKNIKIRREKAGIVHLDGEPQEMEADLQIAIKPFSLTIIN
jgi:diacylglycerol kinase family enzyme